MKTKTKKPNFKRKSFRIKPYGKIKTKRNNQRLIICLLTALLLTIGFIYLDNIVNKALNELIIEPTTIEYKAEKAVIREVTAYSELDSCHYANCAMASGKRAYVGAVACPRDIKLGTKVKIADKWYVCEDRTALSLDGRFDIFMGYGQSSYDNAIKFGKQLLPVKF